MVDMRNGRRMKASPTGSTRRQNYRYSPTSRMTNTYIANGTSTPEEIIANTKYGLFAKTMSGGSVNPATGEFNFSVGEAFMIEDGKITKRVKGATLIGNGKDTIMNIDMVANNQSFWLWNVWLCFRKYTYLCGTAYHSCEENDRWWKWR